MSVIKYPQDIVVEALRAGLTDPRNRYVSDSNTFTATAGQTTFVLVPTSSKRIVRCVNSVTVNSVAINKWQDYDIDLDDNTMPKIILKTASTIGDSVVVNFSDSLSGNEWIYPDFPIGQLGQEKFPRISVIQINKTGTRQGTYNSAISNQVHLQIDCWTKDEYNVIISNKNYTKQALAEYLGNQIEYYFANNEDKLYPKLYNYELVNSNPMPYEEDTQTYRHTVEILLMGENVGI